jgi:hypothetical protein
MGALTIPEPKTKVVGNTHPEEVYEWRKKRFLKLKFPIASAKWLARTHIDLTQMETLIHQGCDHSVAIHILEGTCFLGEDIQSYAKIEIEDEDDDDEQALARDDGD